ncbi:molybdenum hydroxylase [Lachnospiraceae bacterium]|nr:molybdenum hydroxylase [Lachnospiraceae bacterium]
MDREFRILMRGAGDIATGSLHRLFQAGFRPIALETDHPSAIRRQVAFSECIYDGETVVEQVHAVLVSSLEEAQTEKRNGRIPVLIDPAGDCIERYCPDVLIDAILAKKNLGTRREMADCTIGLGPGFTAGEDVDYVIETMRGHRLGRILSEGCACPNTGVPGVIGGYGRERVIHAPADGVLKTLRGIGDSVEAGEVIARICRENGSCVNVPASLTGILRGLIRDGFFVTEGFKIADLDPRTEEYQNCFTISDKARCIAGSVLELVCRAYGEKRK